MSGFDIAQKVKGGLAKASHAVGGGNNSIILQRATKIKNPITGDTVTIENITLVDAVSSLIDVNDSEFYNVVSGDCRLVSNADVEIKKGESVSVNGRLYTVVSVSVRKPQDVVLAYISQLRAQ